MRVFVYLAAITISAGLIYYIGSPGEPQADTTEVEANTVAAVDSSVPPADLDEEGKAEQLSGEIMALSVPGMHCAYGCYPTVKETLVELPGVQGVKLAKQKSEEELDDKTVFVAYTDQFKLDKALEELEAAGFKATRLDEFDQQQLAD